MIIALLLAGGSLEPDRAMARAKACDRVAKPGQGPANFVSSLKRGKTGCLRGKTYRTAGTIKFTRPGVTLRSRPGQRATVIGRIWISRPAKRVTVRGMRLVGRNRDRLPSPTVSADRAVFTRNIVTNGHTGICFILGHSTYGHSDRSVIKDNRIHDCGRLPATNHDHGIYLAHARGTVIRGNAIYSNADRGIQLYPNADRSLITGNVIRGNGQGIIFGGDRGGVSSNNLVVRNVIKNSRIRFNVESHWQGRAGSGNVVRGNCIFGGARREIGGGIMSPRTGFRARDNVRRGALCEMRR